MNQAEIRKQFSCQVYKAKAGNLLIANQFSFTS